MANVAPEEDKLKPGTKEPQIFENPFEGIDPYHGRYGEKLVERIKNNANT